MDGAARARKLLALREEHARAALCSNATVCIATAMDGN